MKVLIFSLVFSLLEDPLFFYKSSVSFDGISDVPGKYYINCIIPSMKAIYKQHKFVSISSKGGFIPWLPHTINNCMAINYNGRRNFGLTALKKKNNVPYKIMSQY